MEPRIYESQIEELAKTLHTGKDGLKEKDAALALKRYGKNEMEDVHAKSTLILFLEQFKDTLVIILMIASVISAALGDWESAVVILSVITLNAVLGVAQQKQAEKSLEGLKKLSAPTARVLRDKRVREIPSEYVTVGDLVLLEAGDYICADGRIYESLGLKVNESALTGESLGVEKRSCRLTGEHALGDQVNMAFAGTFVTYGRGSILVTAVGMYTEMGKIASLLKETKDKKTPLQISLNQFGEKLSVLIMFICALVYGVNLWRGYPVLESFLFAVALAVAAIPEALSSIVTIVLSWGTQKMAKENAVVRKLQAVEGLGSVSVICSDKTGTLTQNRMTVQETFPKNNQELVLLGILCNDAVDSATQRIGDPTELALLDFARERGCDIKRTKDKYPKIDELPFDSDRKLMSTLHLSGDKRRMITKGAVDVLAEKMEMSRPQRLEMMKKNQEFASRGLRVLAFGWKDVEKNTLDLKDENHLKFAGLTAMMDPPREESAQAVADCKRAGIRPVMITGDHKATAASVAKAIGILTRDEEAVEGAQIDRLSDKELADEVEKYSVYARVSPAHKIRIVKAWQDRGHIVAMTGDGVNDAPALKQADVGVAMGITGTEVAKDAASMVLSDDNFATIVKAVENGRNLYDNICRAIQFLLSGNMAGILVVLHNSILGLPLPFTAVHLLFINLLTDSLPAIALGLEPHSHEVMERKPRKQGEGILNLRFLLRIAFEGVVIACFTSAGFAMGMKEGGPQTASTMAFAVLCLSRLVHGFNCKSYRPVLFSLRLFNNLYLWGAFTLGFILLNMVLGIGILRPVFKTVYLGKRLLLAVYGLSLGNLVIIQLAKYVLQQIRKWGRKA